MEFVQIGNNIVKIDDIESLYLHSIRKDVPDDYRAVTVTLVGGKEVFPYSDDQVNLLEIQLGTKFDWEVIENNDDEDD